MTNHQVTILESDCYSAKSFLILKELMKRYENLPSEIIGGNLILKLVDKSDVKDLHYLRTHPEVGRFINRDPPKTEKDTELFIEKIIQNTISQVGFLFAIRDSNSLDFMGTICLWRIDFTNQYAEVGYELLPNWQGKGIMSKALQLILRFGFNDLNLQTIEAYTHQQNLSSIKLLKKNKFELVAGKKDDDNENIIVFRITKAAVL